MATSYEAVFKVVLGRIKDFNIPLMSDEVIEQDLILLMDSAILNFEFPRMNLKQKDDLTMTFNETLDFDTIQLLGQLTAYEWLSRVVMDIDLLKPSMSPEEFKTWSHGNSLIGLNKVLAFHSKRIADMKRSYSRRDENNKSKLGQLSGGGFQ